LCAISGLIFMSLPVPLIVNNFTTFYAHAKARQRLKEYINMQKNLPHKAVAMNFQPNERNRPFSSLGNFRAHEVRSLSSYSSKL
jgi:hypothetical protein